MEICDKVAVLCIELYDKLGKCGKPLENKEWTHLSAIVKEIDGTLNVVSLATGTKCIGGNAMCSDGTVVNDSHAEVLARRAFLRYLYEQIGIVKAGNVSSILKPFDSKYKINENIKWHMFTSQVPCGDASIIPMDNLSNDDCESPPVKRQKVDVHRTGAKPLTYDCRQDQKKPGDAYHTRGAVRIKPGRGDPTLSLSCSDKIAKWIHVGLQGALLSHLLDGRIYLSTIIIGAGGPFNSEIIFNSLVSRASTKDNIPEILQSNVAFKLSSDKIKNGKPSPASIIWSNINHKPLEVSVEGKRLGATKKYPLKGMLKICKRELFDTFCTLHSDNSKLFTYREMKDKAVNYQADCSRFKSNMGSWSKKPPLENFKPS